MNFRPKIDVGFTWMGNSHVFATALEAEESARQWMHEMALARNFRAEETDKSVNALWVNGKLEIVEKKKD